MTFIPHLRGVGKLINYYAEKEKKNNNKKKKDI